MKLSIPPLVSVIIPSYNHFSYLPDAISSIKKQTYPNIEIIIVDDGSSDDTHKIAEQFEEIIYIYQQNQGLSAARNTGARNSKGELLVFLDADDLLYPDALYYNFQYLVQNPEAVFVSGAYQTITGDKINIVEDRKTINSDHYIKMLQSNYIGMHGTVMYRRFLFDEFSYDTSLKACEDHDLYLRISNKYPVIHHNKKLAAYRMHNSNMSGNILLMLSQATEVLKKQEKYLQNDQQRKALEDGLQGYKDYYNALIFGNLRVGNLRPNSDILKALKQYSKKSYYIYILSEITLKRFKIKRLIPSTIFRFLYKLGLYNKFLPGIGKVKMGDYDRTMPISTVFGYDRGGPIDRYYIENFLEKENSSIKGRVLEIGDNDYTIRFGRNKVKQSEILHVNESNPNATIIGDLSAAPQIPDNSFDCIILTQTLHLVYDYHSVIKTCHRILKPNGTLLITVPGITPIDYGEWEKTWLWSFTGLAMEKIMSETFPVTHFEINTLGNVFAATAFLQGVGLPEVNKKSLDFHDPHFQVIVTVKATKA